MRPLRAGVTAPPQQGGNQAPECTAPGARPRHLTVTAQFAVSLSENLLLFCLRGKHLPIGCSVLKSEKGACQGSGPGSPRLPHTSLPPSQVSLSCKPPWGSGGAGQVCSGVSPNYVPLWTVHLIYYSSPRLHLPLPAGNAERAVIQRRLPSNSLYGCKLIHFSFPNSLFRRVLRVREKKHM